MTIQVAILKNELPDDHLNWIKAIEEFSGNIKYDIIDLTHHNWLNQIQRIRYDFYLTKPGAINSRYKQLYDERIFIIENVLRLPIFPSFNEILIYENKRFLSYWLNANKIPHPETYVFYNQQEAASFLSQINYPIVGKTNIGASGSGVTILKNVAQAGKYLSDAFTGSGASRRIGPNIDKSGLWVRGFRYLLNPRKIRAKLNIYKSKAEDLQRGFVIFQHFIQHKYEWRVVRVGNSFFAHKKLLKGEKASGSLLKCYDNPPLHLLDFVRQITDKYKFYSQAVDLFETTEGYLVNEMQCIFGQSDPYQMLIDGEPGRYIFENGHWIFEKGDFARNACYNLRLEFITEQIGIKSVKG